ncbi:hypothetical protein HOP50_06g45070 [Chloropicon primus]|uniref:Uncharacterized protein n=1 Tax=Chloropicon primus TaxID=1764295 RepID=A0A5B8MN26_9CHLO|nr:hypothetical protein A3770_06p44840 [Chloropicon primus]UPR01186.1 hypothetical protein HOP50_06g45070 [Chloropicon primus]|eukprot:QDZ21966.1 hypothetical protein A3770_06p44840 [Chloropicon primus]
MAAGRDLSTMTVTLAFKARLAFVVFAALGLVGGVRASVVCENGYEDPVNVAYVRSRKVAEASGIVSSVANEGILWTHEDSGKHSRLYAISLLSDPPGEIVARVDLDEYTDRHEQSPDFEDIALSRCPHREGYCLWAGDIGDNCARLQSNGQPWSRDCGGRFYLMAVPEPRIEDHGGYEKLDAEDVFEVEVEYPDTGEYPDIPMDSEAMVVSPDGSKAWLIEKRHGLHWDYHHTPARIYETSQNLTSVPSRAKIPLRLVNTIYNPNGWKITGADLHPTGEEMIVRTGDDGGSYAYAFDKPFDFSTIRFEEKVASNVLHQPQPEAVAYDFTNVEGQQVGRAIWHISEQGEGNQPLEYVRCKTSGYQVRGTYRTGELP